MTDVQAFTFHGRLNVDSFLDFARHRARRLDLRLDVGTCDGSAIGLTVTGHEALIDAFEMACSLGPADCIILDVQPGRNA